MENTINEIRDIVNSTDTSNLIISAHAIAHSYDHNHIDESDIYNLLRDILSVVTSIQVLKDTIK